MAALRHLLPPLAWLGAACAGEAHWSSDEVPLFQTLLGARKQEPQAEVYWNDSNVTIDTPFWAKINLPKHVIHEHASGYMPKVSNTPRRTWRQNNRVLIFYAVSSKQQTMDLVKANINHARLFCQGLNAVHLDVYLAHYDESRTVWFRSDMPWYLKNVQFSMDKKGLKFMLARELLMNPHPTMPFLDIQSYEWLWFLDEDVDIRQTNLTRMVLDARKTGSVIITPSIISVSNASAVSTARTADNGESDEGIVAATSSSLQVDSPCQPGERMCNLQAPHSECLYRHTNFIEVSFTLMKPEAFKETTGSCDRCIHRDSVWGMSQVWCSLAAKFENITVSTSCAVLDQVSVVHRNFKTMVKWTKENPGNRVVDYLAEKETRISFGHHFVNHLVSYDCVV